MLALFLFMFGCQPDPADVVASPEFEAAVSAAVAKKMAEGGSAASTGEDMKTMKTMNGMAKCLANVKKSSSLKHLRGSPPDRKDIQRCGRIGLGQEPSD
jgi:hypothetical protein